MGVRSMDLVERLAVIDNVILRLPEEMHGGEQVQGGWKRHCQLKRIRSRGPVTDMTVGQLKDFADTARLPNTPGSSADEAFAIHYPNIGPPGGTIVADGPTSFNFYTVSGGKFWPEDDVLDWLIDNFAFHLQRHLSIEKNSQ